jgi:hypothetical protein
MFRMKDRFHDGWEEFPRVRGEGDNLWICDSGILRYPGNTCTDDVAGAAICPLPPCGNSSDRGLSSIKIKECVNEYAWFRFTQQHR